MGLDQYLTARKYVSSYFEQDKELKERLVTALGLTEAEYTTEFGFGIDIPKVYWRKANQIHAWFVENVQNGEDDCKDYDLATDQLIELRDLCRQVLDNHDLAEELLPVSAGFFFGTYEYDEYYFGQLEHTATELTKIIDTSGEFDYFSYRASW